MSGPKVIDYRAIERQRAEAARRRWLALRGRADALRQRCVETGHPECAVVLQEPADSSSIAVDAHCDRVTALLDAAAEELSRRQLADRTRAAANALHDVLVDLEAREKHAAAQAARRNTSKAQTTSRSAPVARPDYTERVRRQLASLREPSDQLDRAAQQVLSEGDPHRARIMYDDLAHRVARSNEQVAVRDAQLTEIAELRAQLAALTDPLPLDILLEQATAATHRGDDVSVTLRQARQAITAQLDAAAAAADRQYVKSAVAESLREQGYEVVDVEVATAESLILRQSRSHGVRADVNEGRIEVRTVRLGAAPETADRSADRDAEDEFCSRVPGLLDALRRRGIATGVAEAKLPGLFALETVAVRDESRTSSAVREQAGPQVRKRTAR